MRNASVLVVDDDPSILELVREILELEGYDVRTARNGLEALQAVEADWPTLVLLDMRMPVLDGWGFARALRERRLHVKVLVMTAAENANALGGGDRSDRLHREALRARRAALRGGPRAHRVVAHPDRPAIARRCAGASAA